MTVKYFTKGLYTDPSTGEAVKRAGRDWAHDTGSKGPCSEVRDRLCYQE